MKNKYSLDHKKYLRKQMYNTIFVHVCQILLLVLILFAWEGLAKSGLVDPFITSSPSRIYNQLVLMINNGSLWLHASTTLVETIVAFGLSMLIGFVIAVILFMCLPLKRILEPYLVVLNSLPKIALGPLIIIWVGIGTKAIITMGVLLCIVITIISLLNGFCSVETEKIMLLKSMGANKIQILFRLVLPACLPNFISVLKINLGLAWVGVIMGEYLSSRAGLGYLLVYGGQVFKLDLVMTTIVVLCVLAGLMYAFVAILEVIVNKKRNKS